MKTKTHKTGQWIEVLPSINLDWGHGFRIYLSWLWWYVEINFEPK